MTNLFLKLAYIADELDSLEMAKEANEVDLIIQKLAFVNHEAAMEKFECGKCGNHVESDNKTCPICHHVKAQDSNDNVEASGNATTESNFGLRSW